jgi:hypothetical protein
MDKEDEKRVEELVEKRILESKLLVTEKRLQYLLVLFAAFFIVFGLIVPLVQTWQATDKVEKAVQKMEADFKELASKQLRRPDLECYTNGERFEDAILKFDAESGYIRPIMIKNVGDAPSKLVTIRLFLKKDAEEKDFRFQPGSHWSEIGIHEEAGYPIAYEYFSPIDFLDAKETIIISFGFHPSKRPMIHKEFQSPALLKLYYGEPEPRQVQFTVEAKVH